MNTEFADKHCGFTFILKETKKLSVNWVKLSTEFWSKSIYFILWFKKKSNLQTFWLKATFVCIIHPNDKENPKPFNSIE